MIVQCPECSSRYRVDDDIPSTGGRITCPSCSNDFVVYPEDDSGGEASEESTAKYEFEQADTADEGETTRGQTAVREVPSDESGDGQGSKSSSNETAVVSPDDLPDEYTDESDDGQGSQSSSDKTAVVDLNEFPDELTDDVNFEEPSEDMFEGVEDGASSRDSENTSVASHEEPEGGRPEAESTSEIQQEEDGGLAEPETSQTIEEDSGYAGSVLDADEETTESGKPALQDEETDTAERQQVDAAEVAEDEPSEDESVGETALSSPSAGGSGESVSGGVDPDHEGPWQLQTDFGLTYEFPDTQSLNEWLENRDSLTGYELAIKGEEFHELESWPQVAGNDSESVEDIAGDTDSAGVGDSVTGIGEMDDDIDADNGSEDIFAQSTFQEEDSEDDDQPAVEPETQQESTAAASSPTTERDNDQASAKEVKDTTYKPPSREDQWDKVLKFIYPLVPVLFILMLLLLVEATGVYDIRGAVLGTSGDKNTSVTENLQGVKPDKKADSQTEKSKNELQLHVDKLIEDAKKARDGNRLQTALETLKKAKRIDSSRPIIFKMMSNIYEKLGQDKKAKKAEEKHNALSNKN